MTEQKKSTHGGAGRGQGRKPAVPGEKLVPLNVGVTKEQRANFRKYLGPEWLRREIDAAVASAAASGSGE